MIAVISAGRGAPATPATGVAPWAAAIGAPRTASAAPSPSPPRRARAERRDRPRSGRITIPPCERGVPCHLRRRRRGTGPRQGGIRAAPSIAWDVSLGGRHPVTGSLWRGFGGIEWIEAGVELVAVGNAVGVSVGIERIG